MAFLIRFRFILALTCGLTVLLSSSSGECSTRHSNIPVIAHIAGLVVGRDTIETLSSRFRNKGMPVPGQHPIGARTWYVRNLHLILGADGFYYNSRGLIVDTFSLSMEDPLTPEDMKANSDIQKMSVCSPPIKLAFMGVLPGMTKNQVLKRLAKRLSPPTNLQDVDWRGNGRDVLGWHMAGTAACDIYGKHRFTFWNAKLFFDHGKLVEIDVSCG